MRQRKAPGRIRKDSGGSNVTASPSTPAGTGSCTPTSYADVVHVRMPGSSPGTPMAVVRARTTDDIVRQAGPYFLDTIEYDPEGNLAGLSKGRIGSLLGLDPMASGG